MFNQMHLISHVDCEASCEKYKWILTFIYVPSTINPNQLLIKLNTRLE